MEDKTYYLNINNNDKLVWTDNSCYALKRKYISVVEDYEYTLNKIPIVEIEKYLRKIKLNNISENEK